MSRTWAAGARILAAVLGAALLSACGHGSAPGLPVGLGPATPATLNINWGADPPGLNSLTATNSVSFDVLNQVMEGLTRLDAQGTPAAAIARTWDISADGTTYTFHLRDAQWSNGDPVTAEDFLYAWRQALDPRTGAQYAYQLQYIRGAAALIGLHLPDAHLDPSAYATAVGQIGQLEAALGVAAPDDHTLVVHLAKAAPFWLGLTAFPTYFPADEARVSAWGMDTYGTDVAHLVFDGPFVITAWVRKDHLDLTKNARYWDAASVQLGGVHGVMVADAATVDNLYRSGALDALIPAISPAFLQEYQGKPGFQASAAAAVSFLQFNVQMQAFSNPLVRRAFSEAIDRAALVTAAAPGSTPAFAYTPPTIDYAPGRAFTGPVGQVLPTSADPARAKADLAAGLQQLGLTALPHVTLLAGNTSGMQLQSAALQGMFHENLGVSVDVQTVDLQTFLADMRQTKFGIILSGWNADYDDPTTFLDLWDHPGGFNVGGWSDARYTDDLQAARVETDAAKRGADLAAAEKELLAQLPIVPLYWQTRHWITRANVHGLVFSLIGPDYSLKDATKTP